MFYAFIMPWLIPHAYCVLCVVPWVGGVHVYTMWAVHCLSALVSWERLCVSIMVDACMTTDIYIRAVICRCTAYIIIIYIFFFIYVYFFRLCIH